MLLAWTELQRLRRQYNEPEELNRMMAYFLGEVKTENDSREEDYEKMESLVTGWREDNHVYVEMFKQAADLAMWYVWNPADGFNPGKQAVDDNRERVRRERDVQAAENESEFGVPEEVSGPEVTEAGEIDLDRFEEVHNLSEMKEALEKGGVRLRPSVILNFIKEQGAYPMPGGGSLEIQMVTGRQQGSEPMWYEIRESVGGSSSVAFILRPNESGGFDVDFNNQGPSTGQVAESRRDDYRESFDAEHVAGFVKRVAEDEMAEVRLVGDVEEGDVWFVIEKAEVESVSDMGNLPEREEDEAIEVEKDAGDGGSVFDQVTVLGDESGEQGDVADIEGRIEWTPPDHRRVEREIDETKARNRKLREVD